MNKVKKFSFVLAGLLIFYLIIAALFGNDLMLMGLLDFNALLNRGYFGIALVILLALILTSSLKLHSFSIRTSQSWLVGFVAILLISAATSYYANPHNRFPIQKYLSIIPNARAIKIAFYEKLDYDPQLVIMGTSRAFTLSPEYIYLKTGYKTYNLSVEGAMISDYFWQLDYILHQERNSPQALILDIGAPHIPSGLTPAARARMTLSLQPFSMLPYLSPSQQKEVILAYGEDILSLRSFSDSLYLISHPQLTPASQTWTFQGDGYGIRKPITHESYESGLELEIINFQNLEGAGGYFCNRVEAGGEELLEQLISGAEQHNIGVVLYQSPVNGTLLRKLFIKNEQFYQCQKLLTDFVNRLKSKHKNVWYINLIDYKPITGMREAGFYDTIHLRPTASQSVIDQLLHSVQSAVQWSEAHK